MIISEFVILPVKAEMLYEKECFDFTNWLNNEMEQQIAALENITEDPLHQTSHVRLLDFYNSCNAENI